MQNLSQHSPHVSDGEPPTFLTRRRTLLVLVVMSILWGALLIPARHLASSSSASVPLWDMTGFFQPISLIKTAYYLNVSSAPFTITLGLVGGWSFYFIQAYRPAIWFGLLPLVSFLPFGFVYFVQFLT